LPPKQNVPARRITAPQQQHKMEIKVRTGSEGVISSEKNKLRIERSLLMTKVEITPGGERISRGLKV